MHATLLGAIRLTTICALASLVGVLTISCGSDNKEAAPPGGDGGPPIEQPDATGGLDVTVPDGGPFLDAGPCVPQPIDCAGKCGPIRDACSGEVKMCGGCPTGEVCDLQTHTCGEPKVNCADFGAECGLIQNSCGEYKSCGFCAAGQECNPDTNKCQPAVAVTCADLGYECGAAWLGSGPQATKTNCGTCGDPGKPRCNAAYNICEPACDVPWKKLPDGGTPNAAQITVAKKAFCDAARQSKGVECGIISDGCGGTIDCSQSQGFTCPAGQGCGVRGVANRCEPFPTPPECEALGRNCGQLASACGGFVNCGVCGVAGEVCNDNGVCGPPCTPKTCATALPAGTQCGSVSDGCKGTLNCPCPSGGTCQPAGTCCQPKTCAQLLANGAQCGKQLDNGCGGKVNCNCLSGQTCLDSTSQPVSNGEQGTCCVRKTCSHPDYAGKCGSNLSDGCGGTIDCGCGGNQCIVGGPPGTVATPGQVGVCCAETNCPSGACNTTVASVCQSGQNITCNDCPPGQVCNNQTCCSPTGCGNQCGVTISPGCGLPDIACGCTLPFTCNGSVCTCDALTCSSPSIAGKCGTFNNGCNGSVSCGCNGGQVCNNQTQTCCTPKTCAQDYPGQCGTFDNGCGGTISCDPCTGGQVCNPTNGTCCSPKSCTGDYPGLCGNFDNGCGGTLNCNCGGSQVCNPNTMTCCTRLTCGSPQYAGKCGTFPNGCNTGNITCGCSGFNTCGGGGQAGVCGCTPKTCADYPGKVGAQPDGCGGQTAPCSG